MGYEVLRAFFFFSHLFFLSEDVREREPIETDDKEHREEKVNKRER
jgi:hypothetical protein